jgi:hypothetical protein
VGKPSAVVRAVLATVVVLAFTLPSGAAELPRRLQVGEHTLIQNGWGARSKNLLQLYVAGLYLPQKSGRAAEITEADAPMAIRIQITSIFVSQENLVAALNDGFKSSTGGKTASIQKEVQAFRRCFAGEISKGDVFDLVYLPSTGVMVAKNGANQGVIPGLAFKQALFGIWLSDAPADEDLKQAMLGH